MRVSSNATMNEEQCAVFGAETRRLRNQEGISAEAFGELVGCNKAHIYAVEKGLKKPSPQLAERIADAFNITVADMLIPHDEQVKAARKKYGMEINARRVEKGLPMSAVAGALGIPLSVYKEYEMGLCSINERHVDMLDRLLGISEEPKVIEKEVVVEVPVEIPTDICDLILMHIKDLQVDEREQKKLWRYFSEVKMSVEERKLFG